MSLPAIKRLEAAVAILLSLVVLVLLLARAQHAGGLWRDECAVVQLAQMPTFADVVHNFPHEAFPLLFHALIRVFTNIFGTSDIALRCFGLGVGVALITVAWFNARSIGRDVPLFSLAFVGLNAAFLTWGTSIRGYGLGSILILLALGLMAKVLLEPTGFRIVAAALVCLAAVQCLLHNAVLLFGIGISAAIVCLFRRDFKRATIILGIGSISALSLLPYIGPYFTGSPWNIVVKSEVTSAGIWHHLNAALGADFPLLPWAWYILFLILISAAVWGLYSFRATQPAPEWDILLFGVFVLVASVLAYYVFFNVLSYVPQPWYYVALISVLGGTFDLLLIALSKFQWLRLGRLAVAIVALIGLPIADWPKVTERQTNIDVVAHKLEQSAGPPDLIVVTPWQLGIPFSWYYHGGTPWVTLPSIPDHHIHRYDLFKEKMTSSIPIDDVLERIRDTLQSGHRVWVVGGMQLLRPGQTPLRLAPAPHPKFGWANVAYMSSWAQQMSAAIQHEALHGAPVLLPMPGSINPLESVPLVVVQGWKEPSGVTPVVDR
jgi:hypothetical protein